MRILLLLVTALVLLGVRPALAASPPPAPPVRPAVGALYCVPRAYRDYEVVIGRAAALRPAPGCRAPSLVRKVSGAGVPSPPVPVPLPTPNRPLVHVWLFLSRLEYTLDGATWHPLRLIP